MEQLIHLVHLILHNHLFYIIIKHFLNETDVLTWESILAKAKTSNKQALSLSGVDGFNNSFLLLATNAETGASSLKLI